MAIGATTSQIIATMLEEVEKSFPAYLIKKESKFAQKFNKAAPKHKISAYTAGSGAVLAWRIPVNLAPGGDASVISLDGGDLGTGSMEQDASMTLAHFESDIAYNIPARAVYATTDKAQAIANVMQRSLGGAVKEMALYNEVMLFGDGTGVLATATAVTGAGTAATDVTYTLETTAFRWYRLIRKGQLLDVANGSNAILAVGCRLKSINFSANQVTITVGAVGYTPTATDQLLYPGMGPVTTVIAAGSFRAGIYTYNTTNTTGSLNGLPYATAYELACPNVNAGGTSYSAAIVFAGKSQVVQRRDDDDIDSMIAVCAQAQRVAWYNEGITIANQMARPGEALKSMDMAGQGTKYGDTFEAGDITHFVSRFANLSRVDWLIPNNFGYVQLKEIGFYETMDGQRIFNGRNPITGNPTAGSQFYVVNTRNLYSMNPGSAVVNYNLSIPPGQ